MRSAYARTASHARKTRRRTHARAHLLAEGPAPTAVRYKTREMEGSPTTAATTVLAPASLAGSGPGQVLSCLADARVLAFLHKCRQGPSAIAFSAGTAPEDG